LSVPLAEELRAVLEELIELTRYDEDQVFTDLEIRTTGVFISGIMSDCTKARAVIVWIANAHNTDENVMIYGSRIGDGTQIADSGLSFTVAAGKLGFKGYESYQFPPFIQLRLQHPTAPTSGKTNAWIIKKR